MTRHFLSNDAQARYSQARLDSIREIAHLAAQEDCAFVVVAGDIFESNHCDNRTLLVTLDSLAEFRVPVFLVPGNHDPVNAGSVYQSQRFIDKLPKNVYVFGRSHLFDLPEANAVIIGAPWLTKRLLSDPLDESYKYLNQTREQRTILVGHGIIDTLNPDPSNPAIISLTKLEALINNGFIDYVALGDRHSTTSVGSTNRIWYSGTPVATDYDEIDPNNILLVELSSNDLIVTPKTIGTWHFVKKVFEISSSIDLNRVEEFLSELPNKPTTIVKFGFRGTVSIESKARLESILSDASELIGALEVSERQSDLVIIPDQLDLAQINLVGYAAQTFEELYNLASTNGPESQKAQRALALFYRLAKGAK